MAPAPLLDVLTALGNIKYTLHGISPSAKYALLLELRYHHSEEGHHALLDASVPGDSTDRRSFGLYRRSDRGSRRGEDPVFCFPGAFCNFARDTYVAPGHRGIEGSSASSLFSGTDGWDTKERHESLPSVPFFFTSGFAG